uniref:Uncharacterized protein n=1 Tax=Ditylenchus dipsaci TaxID=166011 RepID=A0A915DB61_9BILA
MANINAINIHQFFDIQPDANGNLWAICFYCLGGPYRMRHAQHFGHLYSHSAACQATDLLNHALQSILNPAPFNVSHRRTSSPGGRTSSPGGGLQAHNGILQGQIGGLQAQNNNTINILRTQLIANGLQPQA